MPVSSDALIRHVYVHVPFCRRRCVYCDFSIAVRRDLAREDFTGAIERELRWHREHAGWWETARAPLATVYFGGGTPSLVAPERIGAVLELLNESFGLRDDVEITLEANPEDVTADRVTRWRGLGVNRLSIGVQSFHDQALAWMHRSHSGRRAEEAVICASAHGFDNLSIDLIFALPPALDRAWHDDLEAALRLGTPHVSLYGLTVEPRTPLARWVDRAAVETISDERYAEEYLAAYRTLEAAGMRFYELSNAAFPGRESRHNSAYWDRVPYLGLGPAAHSHLEGVRWWNESAWASYARRLAAGETPIANREELTEEGVRLERWYLGLRTRRGVSAATIPGEVASRWRRAGLVDVSTSRIVPTASGWLVLDRLMADLTEGTDGA